MSTSFANKIDNLDIYAKRAECDAAGNTLSTTYATKSELPGSSQLVPSATSADADKVLTVDSLGVPGWAIVPSQSTGLFQATYGTSTYNEVRTAVTANKIVYCSVSGRMAFLAYIGSSNYEFQYYRSNSSSSGTDSVFVYKVSSSGWETTERPVKAGNISYPVTQVNVNGSSAMTGTVANITVQAVPAVTSSDNNKVLKASYSGGTGSYSWETESGGGGTQADWTESDTSDPSYIQNKPTIVGIAAGSNVSISEENNTLTIAATDTTYTAGTGLTLANGEFSVDTTTVAMKTDIPSVPTTDQTYNSSSTNPQSGTAVAGAISGLSQVPAVTSSDDTKVLTASYTGGVASYSWQTAQGGGGGTSNVTTADKQINVAVNGTGLPMQLNLLNPTANRTEVNIGHPSIGYSTCIDDYQFTSVPAIELYWMFNKSAVDFASLADEAWRIRTVVSNDITLIAAANRDPNSGAPMLRTGFTGTMGVDLSQNELRNASTDAVISRFSFSDSFNDGNAAVGVKWDNLSGDNYIIGKSSVGDYLNSFDSSAYEAATTLKLSCFIYGVKSITVSPDFSVTFMTQAELADYAAIISQHLSDITLYMPGPAASYASYIGSVSISGQTTTADSSYSGLYRYDFTAEQTAALVPGVYLVQVSGPSSSGNQSTWAYLFKDGGTGYNYYTSDYKASYLSGSGARKEIFLMNLEANTTSIGTRVSYGNFTMVRIG